MDREDTLTVQELSDILVSDVCHLLNLSCSEGHLHNINAADLKLILDICCSHGLHSVHQAHLPPISANPPDRTAITDPAHKLLSHEVADLNHTVVVGEGHIDGKVGVNKSHLVEETNSHSSDHVFDVRAHSANTSKLLAVCEPQLNSNCAGSSIVLHVQSQVLERALHSTPLSCDRDCASIHHHLNWK